MSDLKKFLPDPCDAKARKNIKPKLQADTDRLQAMFKTLEYEWKEGADDLSSGCVPIHHRGESKTVEVLPGIHIAAEQPGPFAGLSFCPGCLTRAKRHMLDMANTIEDMLTVYNDPPEQVDE